MMLFSKSKLVKGSKCKKGITLIELTVTILIMALLMGVVSTIMIMSGNLFSEVSANAEAIKVVEIVDETISQKLNTASKVVMLKRVSDRTQNYPCIKTVNGKVYQFESDSKFNVIVDLDGVSNCDVDLKFNRTNDTVIKYTISIASKNGVVFTAEKTYELKNLAASKKRIAVADDGTDFDTVYFI